jgi:hypothetical protein
MTRAAGPLQTPFAVSLSNRFPFSRREGKAFDKLRPNGFRVNRGLCSVANRGTSMNGKFLALSLALIASPAGAQLRDFCPDRPGLGTPPCTLDRGHVAIELGAVDWTMSRQAGVREDRIGAGETLVRYGVSDSLEVQLGWQGAAYVRQRASGEPAHHHTGVGDVTLAMRGNLRNPDGSGLSVALMPFVTLPTGGRAIGERDWTAGLIVPVSYELSHDVQLAFTGEADAAADAQGSGHHLAYSGTAGLSASLVKDLDATLELAIQRDEVPGDAATALLSGISLAWTPSEAVQLDGGANIGLDADSPDLELYVGVAKRF